MGTSPGDRAHAVFGSDGVGIRELAERTVRLAESA
ncbi:hypothetical protein J3A78_006197 [Streptomyces sp. PvR006]|nr:hypothetical protein [Streptomyces sp. PvR006]